MSNGFYVRHGKAQDILSYAPDCRRKKRAHHEKTKNIAMTGCLSLIIVSSLKAVRHRYNYSFCFHGVLGFFPPAIQP